MTNFNFLTNFNFFLYLTNSPGDLAYDLDSVFTFFSFVNLLYAIFVIKVFVNLFCPEQLSHWRRVYASDGADRRHSSLSDMCGKS